MRKRKGRREGKSEGEVEREREKDRERGRERGREIERKCSFFLAINLTTLQRFQELRVEVLKRYKSFCFAFVSAVGDHNKTNKPHRRIISGKTILSNNKPESRRRQNFCEI